MVCSDFFGGLVVKRKGGRHKFFLLFIIVVGIFFGWRGMFEGLGLMVLVVSEWFEGGRKIECLMQDGFFGMGMGFIVEGFVCFFT